MVDLTKTSIDFQDIVAELEADLRTRESFQALFPGETSKIFTEHGAGITALMLYHIHSATQNAFFPTAFSKQAVYALAASLGRPPRRKLGAQLEVQLTVNTALAGSITLPKYSRFSARGLEWYTVEDYVIPAGLPAGHVLDQPGEELVLRQGERITDSFPATGNANQRIEIGDDFNIDEFYLDITVNGIPYTKNGSSLLNASAGDLVYAEQTASNGRVLILFGNTVIGTIPTLSANIEISYSNTVGSSSNSSITNDPFQYLEVFDIGGGTLLELDAVSITSSSGGSDEETIDQVKNVAPKVYAANERAVRRDDYLAFLLSFTGATAGAVWGEYEEAQRSNKADLTMMNRVYVSAVPSQLTTEQNVIATGTGSIANFSGNVGFTNILPGSVTIDSATTFGDPQQFYDENGKGILLSDNISFSIVPGAISGTASANVGANPDNAFDGFPQTSYDSGTLVPDAFNPARLAYDFGAGNEEILKSIRLLSDDTGLSGVGVTPARGAAKKVIVLASNEISPDLNNRDDWVILRNIVTLDEPGYNSYSKWIALDNPNDVAYRHIMVEVLETHGGFLRINRVEIQTELNLSTIDYVTGDYSLTYETAGASEPNGDITFNGRANNFSPTYKQQILDHLDNYNHFTTLLEYRDPIAVPITIDANVYFLEGFDSGTILSNVQTAISNLFTIDSKILGKPLYLSDIYQAIQDVEGVDYSILNNPTTDTIVGIDQLVILSSQTLNILPTDR